MAVEKTEGDSSTSRAKDSTTEAESPTAIESPTLDTPPRNIDGWKWYLTFISILASTFLYALDVTVVADLQAVIVEELGGIQNLAWLSVAFLLCATAVNLVCGRMYGQVNVKWLFIVNAVIFEVGSAICGAAPSLNGMILGRALAVMGGPGLYVGCMTLIAATTTFTERPLSVSCTALTWGLGIVLGPVVGGAFSESDVGWRWAFYINIFIGAACAPFYLLLIPSIDPRPGATIKERWAELDDPGILLQGGALTAFILALNLGGLTFPWNSARIISMFVVAGVLFILLGIQQTWAIGTCPSRRIIPVQFFRSRTVLLLFSCTAASGACAFVPILHGSSFLPVHAWRHPVRCRVAIAAFSDSNDRVCLYQRHIDGQTRVLHAVVLGRRFSDYSWIWPHVRCRARHSSQPRLRVYRTHRHRRRNVSPGLIFRHPSCGRPGKCRTSHRVYHISIVRGDYNCSCPCQRHPPQRQSGPDSGDPTGRCRGGHSGGHPGGSFWPGAKLLSRPQNAGA
ncbi:MFS drug efflux transporter [Blastomyces dermatitidis ER-3]|uniref:MFS drug efflux transporter n=1 Tax=Ajellomyces dermatitidis (strain ER-3 / ATCC MYA-2586) TaxID=559297 RepID=A0ABP2EMK7_AJEDR|nr:MFS drug efflux transporter [Blastomyces dermatitidis ER-3]EEQ84590.2 MFS drug efflux transporter [Blastomyces dermatitidis ER-3]